jgi:chaperonin cofactor prefoldin
MTNDELFEDLKQFINAKIDGVELRLESKIDHLDSRIDSVESSVKDLKEGLEEVNLKLDTLMDATAERLEPLELNDKKQDKRLTKLEQALA